MPTRLKCIALVLAWSVLSVLVISTYGHNVWKRPGCHKVGKFDMTVPVTLYMFQVRYCHTRKVSIPDCVEFHITTNACRGFCESWSIPSAIETLRVNPFQLITSVGQCCNIMETEDPQDIGFSAAKTYDDSI
ncbi:hypothetical protein RUM43_009838 [Polyplax serrata]|uniref:DAN domain-containing protein n=1 Tax=Polyplax serrata TaxID=468196 RepID=A0AAN8P7R0_POLSC